MVSVPNCGPFRNARDARQATGLIDLPKELVAGIVSHLPYAALPAFRTTCKLARELVDAASNGWVMKVEEGEALQTSGLLQRLTSLVYVWFERWTWEGEQEANFLAIVLMNLSVFAKLQEIRFPGTPFIPLRCLRGLLAALPAVTTLALPPLPPALPPESPAQRAALASVAGLTALVDLNLEGWALTDAGARALTQGLALGQGGGGGGGGGLARLQRLVLGNTGALSWAGYSALAALTGLQSLTLSGARGNNSTLEPLAALTSLTGLRVELAPSFGDEDPGPLACLPALRTLGWWHAEPQPAAGVRPGRLGPWLRELSLIVDLDMRALGVIAGSCTVLAMMQVNTVRIPTAEGAAAAAAAAAAVASSAGAAACSSSAASVATTLGLGLPVLPSLRTLILGDLSLPPPEEPQPVAHLAVLFPAVENLLAFQVGGRGLLQLARAERLRRLVLNCPGLQDAALAFLPPLPSLTGLQLEGCAQLTDAAAAALRSTPGLEQLLLLDTAAVTDAFLAAAAAQLRCLRTLVLSRLPSVHDEGLQSLVGLKGSLEHLELRCMPELTPAGLAVALQLPRLGLVAVAECERLGRAACRDLEAALAAAGREDVSVEHETTVLVPVSLADEFGEQQQQAGPGGQEGGGGAAAAAGQIPGR